MSRGKDNVNTLLAAINRQPTGPSVAKPPEESAPAKPSAISDPHSKTASGKKSKSKVGKPVQFWMHDEDRKLVRELSAWLAGQGIRPSDSMVIRAALRMAKVGSPLVEAYWEAAKLDGRIKRDS